MTAPSLNRCSSSPGRSPARWSPASPTPARSRSRASSPPSINWGDGTTSSAGMVSIAGAGFDVTGSHTYASSGTDSISVSITDAVSGATVTADSTATVAAPSYSLTAAGVTVAATTGVPFQGTVASFTSNAPSSAVSRLHGHDQLWRRQRAPPARSWRLPAGSSSSARTPTRPPTRPMPVTVTITDTAASARPRPIAWPTSPGPAAC